MSRVLRTSPFLYLGSLSYAIYLVPWPLLYILTQYAAPPAAYYLAVLVAAAFTHHVVEVAARRFLMSRSPTAWRAGAVRNASTRT